MPDELSPELCDFLGNYDPDEANRMVARSIEEAVDAPPTGDVNPWDGIEAACNMFDKIERRNLWKFVQKTARKN